VTAVHFVIATPYFPTAYDPTSGSFIHRQAVALRRRGQRVDVIHILPRPLPLRRLGTRWRARLAGPAYAEPDGLGVHRTHYLATTQRAGLRPLQAAAVARAVMRVLDEHPALQQADVLYAQWLVPFGWGCLHAARRFGMRCMAIGRGIDLNVWADVPSLRRQLLALVGRADAILGNGEYVERELVRIAGGPLSRPVHVIYNPCDLEAFFAVDGDREPGRRVARRALDLHPTAPLILFLGQLDPRKGPDTLVDALARLGAPWRLVIAGNGPLRSELEAQAARAGVGDRVRFLGSVAHHITPALMAACDVLALPSRREGLPNAAVEALAAAMPVVATPVGGTAEIVRQSETGWLVPPGAPDALAEALRSVAERPHEARERGEAGRILVRERFDLSKNLARLEAITGALRVQQAAT